MAIITETVTINGRQYVHTFSSEGMMIRGGSPEGDYAEAYDPMGSGRTYTETDVPIDDESTAEEVVDILTGVIE